MPRRTYAVASIAALTRLVAVEDHSNPGLVPFSAVTASQVSAVFPSGPGNWRESCPWDDFYSQLSYLIERDHVVRPTLQSFVDSNLGRSWGSMFAMSVVPLLPVFLTFLIGRRFLVRGIVTTGIE